MSEIPSKPITRKEQYLAKAAGQAVEIPAEPITREEAYLDAIAKGSGGGGGTSDYSQLTNKPQINGTTLTGNKSASDLSLASTSDLAGKVDKVDGKGLSTNDYTDADKAIVGGVTAALASKQDALTAGDYIEIDGNDEISVNPVVPNEVATYQIVSDGSDSGTYFVRINKIVDGEVVLTEQYSTRDNVKHTFDDTIVIDYANTVGWNFTYELLVNSTTHDAGYTYSWGYSAQVDIDEVVVIADHSGENLVLKAQMDTALAGKQDTLTFDSVPTDGSTNPVESNGVYDALALKQDATDINLTTTSKTVVGGINELKSGLTNLDNEVNGDATTYPYADVITIEDAIPANVADCSVKIEPVQDLHGYDKPWVGGAGKNKCEGYLQATIDSSGTIVSDSAYITHYGKIESGKTYTISNIYDQSGKLVYGIFANEPQIGDTASGGRVVSDSFTFTAASDGYIAFRSNYDHTDGMLEEGTTATTYEPYSNICPITGHTEASVQRDGRNLIGFGKNTTDRTAEYRPTPNQRLGFDILGDNKIKCKTVYQNSVWNTGYIEVAVPPYSDLSKFRLSADITEKSAGITSYNPGFEIDLSKSSIGHIIINIWMNDNEVVSVGEYFILDNVQLEYGETATEFSPYAGKTYTIALGSTIYGGTLRIDSNGNTVMDVDRAERVYDGSEDENWQDQYGLKLISISDALYSAGAITCFSNEFKTFIDTISWADLLASDNIATITKDGNIIKLGVVYKATADLTEFKAFLANSPLQICYELATPTTIQLTPQQIQLLKGQNTLTASTGDISVTVNGVAGAIGSVQEQVNELAEDVAVLDNLISHGFVTIPTGFYCEDAYKAKYTAIGNGTHGIVQINGVIKTSQALTASTDYTICSVPFTSIREAFGLEFNESGTIAIDKDSGDVVYTPSDSVAQYTPIKFSIAFCF